MAAMVKRGITIERQVLLFEIERRCSFTDCNAKNSIGLTKSEARNYSGFECSVCERWTKDQLSRKDIPDWWDELTTTPPADQRGN